MAEERALRRGDVVEVRSAAEIRATLDEHGALDGLPFMPEMMRHCGRRFTVLRRAEKICDTINSTGSRRLRDTVLLDDLRCDGSAHGGCQAECRIFWKEAWLRSPGTTEPAHPTPARRTSGCTETRIRASAQVHTPGDTGGDPVYVCQATLLPRYTRPLKWWDIRQYVRDVSSGNHSFRHVASVLFIASVRTLGRLPFGYRMFRVLYDFVHLRLAGRVSPHVHGVVPRGDPTPQGALDLQPGELVGVKPLDAIVRTLDADNKNRGLRFDPEMARYSRQTFSVRQRITRIIDERTGRMIRMKQPCITLEGVVCAAEYSQGRLLCPRAITSYWRELWLERVPTGPEAGRADQDSDRGHCR
jgi:hypothetical protein